MLGEQLRSSHGKLSPALSIKNVTSIAQTGNLHIAVYDLSEMQMYVANARGKGETGADFAYDRTFLQLDMNALFSMEPITA